MHFKNFVFSISQTGDGLPLTLEARFHPIKGGRDLWSRFCDTAIMVSHATIFVASNSEMFEAGILELKLASGDPSYRECNLNRLLTILEREYLSD
jgi:hypothetical protein